MKEAIKLRKVAFQARLAGGRAEAKTDRLSAGLKEVLVNPQVALEREAGLSPVCAEPAGPAGPTVGAHGGLGQYLRRGGLGWWFPFFEKGTKGSAASTGRTAQSPGESIGC